MPRVSIPDTKKVFEIGEGEILYDALDDQNEKLPHGCLSGSCGACRVEILDGSQNLSEPGLIESNTLESLKNEFIQLHGPDFVKDKCIRLSCRAKVRGDISFRPLK